VFRLITLDSSLVSSVGSVPVTSVNPVSASEQLLATIPVKVNGYGCEVVGSKSESDGLSDSLSDDVLDQFEQLKIENAILKRKCEESQLVIIENKEVIKSLGNPLYFMTHKL